MEESLRHHAHAARARIIAGTLRGTALADLLLAVPHRDRDVFTDELLAIGPPPPDLADLPRGAVPYLPCGVDDILAMVRDVPLGPADTFVDLGAGLGRVVILAHLLSGAAARGIELQPHLVAGARATSAALALPPAVSFELANAEVAPLDGSVVFLYAPFNGAMLGRVVARLAALARTRRITICTVDVALHEPWLVERRASSGALAIYDPLGLDAR